MGAIGQPVRSTSIRTESAYLWNRLSIGYRGATKIVSVINKHFVVWLPVSRQSHLGHRWGHRHKPDVYGPTTPPAIAFH